MRWGRTLGVAVGTAVLLGATLVSSAPGTAKEPVRILLVGDSVTQGSAGDWTWRYRLWRHLVGTGVRVDLVGPRDDLLDNVTGEFGSHAYLDPGFDQDHAARWGMFFAGQDHPIGELVDEYHPDVVVELLGVNDLAWTDVTSEGVSQDARQFVEDARAADPDVDVVLGALPQAWISGVAGYDESLPGLAAELDTDTSRVVAATPPAAFVEGVDTWDSAHPTASGEVKVAAGVADALAGLGIGTEYPRPLPDPPLGPRIPAELAVTPGDGAAELSWVSPPGATAAYVWIRDTTNGEDWGRLPFPLPGPTWTAGDLVNGHEYEFRLQSEKGSVAAEDLYSNVATVTPRPAP